jgi:WD repeat-containing protein 68
MRNGSGASEEQPGVNHVVEDGQAPSDHNRESDESQETNIGDRPQPSEQPPPCHIFTYESPWKIYALGYSWRQDQPFRFALGSFLDEKANKVNGATHKE